MSGLDWKGWGLFRAERSLSKDHENYKREAMEDREMSSVFIIINEWTDNQNNEGSEVVGAKYFASEDEAWGALKDIAEAYNVSLEQGETNIVLEDHASHLQYEEYYIQELTKGQ